MRNIVIVLLSSILIYACAGSKDAQIGTTSQEPCRDQSDVSETNVFTGESINNLNVFQQGSSIYATMDVRTTCNSEVAFDMEQIDDQVRLKMRRSNAAADCVCVKKVTTSIANVDEGSYKITVVNSNNQLLDQKDVTIR